MAEKETKPKTTPQKASAKSAAAKPAAAAAKPAATKQTTAKAKAADSTAKKVAEPAKTKTATAANKTSETAKPAAKTTEAKPAAKTAATAKTTAASSATKKAEVKPAPAPAAKPAASAATPAQVKKPAAAAATTQKSAAKPKTTAKTKKTKKSESSDVTGASVLVKNKKFWYIVAAAAVSFVLILSLILGLALGIKSCKRSGSRGPGATIGDGALSNIIIDVPTNGVYNLSSGIKPSEPYEAVSMGEESFYNDNEIPVYAYNAKYTTSTVVGYSGRVIGTVERNIPQTVRDEGLGVYPKYGYTLSTVIGSDSDKVAARNALIAESSYLTATGTANAGGGGYTWMDENGLLYSGTRSNPVPTMDKSGKQRTLYKHTASIGLYMGDVSDDEPAIIKEVTYRNRAYNGYGVTGVYAPAGELIKIQLSDADMTATGGIVIHIGQALYNGQANNIWAEKGQMQRIPHLLNTMTVSKDTAVYDEETGVWTAYVGSFIGGPLYIRNETATFTATISGGVAYQHFILGYTTEKEFEENAKSSAPYFDLEVWDRGVLHSGPMYYAKAFNYEQLYNAAVLWDKVAAVATTNGTYQGIVFLYDPFVAAGAAVAFPGRRSVNCPMGWMSSSLNYDAIVTSGSWGNFHEYHHNFQNFGIGYTGEVTNNALTLVDYSLFTKISAARSIGSYGGAGLSGWNCYTSATWALQQVNANNINSTSGLAVYATLLHNFGQDAFINARGYSGVNYFNRWADVTHYDFSYYASSVVTYAGVDYNEDANFATNNYPEFVPVSSVYQTGRSYIYRTYDSDKNVTATETRDIETMKPYIIPYGADFTVDLNKYDAPGGQYASGSVIIGDGFNYTIKSVDISGLNGNAKFVESAEKGVYTFTPDESYALSGKIRVTLSITYGENKATTYNGHALDDVDLILEFEQSHEANKAILERTTYTYTADTMYADAREAFNSGFENYTTKDVWNHTNPTQNCNTDIWLCTPSTLGSFPNADPDRHLATENTIEVLEGKLYIAETGKYRVYLRGRLNCALYWSLDGEDYTLGAFIADSSTSAAFRPNDENTYFDIEFDDEGNVFVDGELVMDDYSGTRWVYIKEVLIVQTITTSQTSYIGVGLTQWTVPLYTTETDDKGNTHYYNSSGQEVTAEEASNVDPIEPKNGTYANAYRNNYEFPDNSSYESDYFYIRNYNYNYVGEPEILTNKDNQTYMESISNYSPWNDDNELLSIYNLFDGDSSTNIHTHNNFYVSETSPAIIAFDMGETVKANSLTLYVYSGNLGERAFPKVLLLEGSLDGETWFEMGNWSSLTANYSGVALSFPEQEFQYYKITVTKSNWDASPRFALSGLELAYTVRFTGNGANNISPDKATYSNGFDCIQTYSVYGHAYLGHNGDTIKLEFTGTRFAVLNTTAYDKDYEVWIDGEKVESIDVVPVTGAYGICYISEQLTNTTHTVEIRCTGEACFDSFAFYSET